MLLNGAGLRLGEELASRIKDLDLDRRPMLPERLVPGLARGVQDWSWVFGMPGIATGGALSSARHDGAARDCGGCEASEHGVPARARRGDWGMLASSLLQRLQLEQNVSVRHAPCTMHGRAESSCVDATPWF